MFRWSRDHDAPEVPVSVSTATVIRVIALVIAAYILLLALHRAAHALLLIFAAFFLALALNAPVAWIAHHLPGKKRGSRALATSASFLIVIIILGAFIASVAPPLIRQTHNLINAAPHLIREVHDQNSEIGRFIRHYHLQGQVDTFSSQLSNHLKHSGGTAYSTLAQIGSSVFSLLTILVLTFMMLVEGPRRLEFIRELLPRRHKDLANRLSRDMYRVIKGYVNGQVTLAALAALLITPALFILHIGYPAALIFVIFICGLIPMVGHTIGAIIVTIVALFHSTTSAIIILAYYILYQQIENYLIQPRIQANSTDMSPLLVFASLIVGVSFGGLLGGLVAIPVAGCLRVALLEYLRTKRLIDAPVVEETIHDATDKTK